MHHELFAGLAASSVAVTNVGRGSDPNPAVIEEPGSSGKISENEPRKMEESGQIKEEEKAQNEQQCSVPSIQLGQQQRVYFSRGKEGRKSRKLKEVK